MFSFTRFCLRVLADLNEIIRRLKHNVIMTIAITFFNMCINMTKSRNKCHNVVDLIEAGRYAINAPREGGDNPVL